MVLIEFIIRLFVFAVSAVTVGRGPQAVTPADTCDVYTSECQNEVRNSSQLGLQKG